MKKKICLVGLGKIGEQLAYNFKKKNISFDIWDTNKKKLNFINKEIKKKNIKNIKDYIKNNKVILLLLIPHSKVENFLQENNKYLKKNDIIIDLGNSNPDNTIIRYKKYYSNKIYFFGIGFSGGVEAAKKNPCLMAAGNKKEQIIITNIVKKLFSQKIQIIGTDQRLGHLSKICHNSIEYSIMQILAEFYNLQKKILFLTERVIIKNFNKLNNRIKNFYLGELSQKILNSNIKRKINYGVYDDQIDHNNTSKWFNILCLENNIAAPSLLGSFEKRLLSKNPKKKKLIKKSKKTNVGNYIETFEFLIYCSYIQGIYALISYCKIKKIKINTSALLKVWSENSIIASEILNKINNKLEIKKILTFDFFKNKNLNKFEKKIINLINLFLQNKQNPISMFSTYNWILSMYKTKNIDNIFIQILRNKFGSHKLK